MSDVGDGSIAFCFHPLEERSVFAGCKPSKSEQPWRAQTAPPDASQECLTDGRSRPPGQSLHAESMEDSSPLITEARELSIDARSNRLLITTCRQ